MNFPCEKGLSGRLIYNSMTVIPAYLDKEKKKKTKRAWRGTRPTRETSFVRGPREGVHCFEWVREKEGCGKRDWSRCLPPRVTEV
ncbi:hypothetical protein NPIL_595731 [Nephila pilipes]|uniref:Uncharacterized protein n=1 Tax=Nephila pilipes TaxID=299642 RepID=A0A8X6QDG7_NEPPI|nr:hypothetical protein NPIL_595731 [Nephila pilipes]